MYSRFYLNSDPSNEDYNSNTSRESEQKYENDGSVTNAAFVCHPAIVPNILKPVTSAITVRISTTMSGVT